MYALGKTKVFFRTGQVALLERILHQKLTNSAVMIQKIWKGYISRKKYQHIKESLRKIQVSFTFFPNVLHFLRDRLIPINLNFEILILIQEYLLALYTCISGVQAHEISSNASCYNLHTNCISSLCSAASI